MSDRFKEKWGNGGIGHVEGAGKRETVSDIDLVILGALPGNCNLPPQRMEREGVLLRGG